MEQREDIREIGHQGEEDIELVKRAIKTLATWKVTATGNYASQIEGRLTGLKNIKSRYQNPDKAKPYLKKKSFGLGFVGEHIYVAFEFTYKNDGLIKLDGIVKTTIPKVLELAGREGNRAIINGAYAFLSELGTRVDLEADDEELVDKYYNSGWWVLSENYFEGKDKPDNIDQMNWDNRMPDPEERGIMRTKLRIYDAMWGMTLKPPQ